MKTNKKRAFWPYIITAVAVIVVIALLAAFVFPSIAGRSSSGMQTYSNAAYESGEHQLKSPSSYEELYATLEDHQPKNYYNSYELGGFSAGNGMVVEEAVAEESADGAPKETMAATSDAAVPAASGGADYSDTNVRTEGVLEGDIVKTDGRYIYSIYPYTGVFTIADTEKEMQLLYSGTILEDNDFSCKEFYVVGDKLYFTGSHDVYAYDSDAQSGSWSGQAFLKTFDISDRTHPELIATYTQSGRYISARMTDNDFYLFTNFFAYDLNKNTCIPTFNGEKIACEDIFYGNYFTYPNYYCIGAVDLSDPGNCRSAKAVLTDNGEFYVSNQTIYIYSDNWVTQKGLSYSETSLVSIRYDGTELKETAIGSIPGYINDSFSIDEYNGFLRLVTTVNRNTYKEPGFFDRWFNRYGYYDSENTTNNSLWILDQNLEQISSIENIQDNELVQSARFLGDTVYFVTFRNTDPLFAADLSDPYNPKMLGGLQLNGFSNYLHFWDDGLLLGIGYDGDEFGNLRGAKLSMFDISDPKNVREIDRYTLDEQTSILSTDYSYKSVMIEPEKNLIGFSTESYLYDQDAQFDGAIGTYYVFCYNQENGFKQQLAAELYRDNYGYNYWDEDWTEYEDVIPPEFEDEDAVSDSAQQNSIFNEAVAEAAQADEPAYEDIYMYLTTQYTRGMYINDRLYIVNPGYKIYAYDLATMTLQDTLSLYSPQETN